MLAITLSSKDSCFQAYLLIVIVRSVPFSLTFLPSESTQQVISEANIRHAVPTYCPLGAGAKGMIITNNIIDDLNLNVIKFHNPTAHHKLA